MTDLIDNLDIGATDVLTKKDVVLVVQWRDDRRYELHIAGRTNKLTVVRSAVGLPDATFMVSTEPEIADVIGYAFRRAVCRGIDKSEIIETGNLARIDLGHAPKWNALANKDK